MHWTTSLLLVALPLSFIVQDSASRSAASKRNTLVTHNERLCRPQTISETAVCKQRSTIKALVAVGSLALSSCAASSAAADLLYCNPPDISLVNAAELIRNECSVILSAVRSTGRVLYRGGSYDSVQAQTNQPLLQFPQLDLLSPGTYKNAPLAVDYFRCLSERIDSADEVSRLPVSPANAHLAAADLLSVATQWGGAVVSVWPLDAGLHYAWLLRDSAWWDDSWASPQGKRGPLFWRSEERLDRFINSEVRCDSGLEAVLAKGGELMFTNCPTEQQLQLAGCKAVKNGDSSSIYSRVGGFISVPLQLEPQLLRLLDVVPFSTAARVATAQPMQAEGDIKRKFNIHFTER